MRKIVILQNPIDETKRLMIYNDKSGTYLFGFKKTTDCNADWDEYYDSESDAIEICEDKYGVKLTDWYEIPNPELFCQHDWIENVRIKGSEKGNPEYGKFEKFSNGKWVEHIVID